MISGMSENSAQPLSIVIEDLSDWLSRALRGLFYKSEDILTPEPLKSFQDWLDASRAEKSFQDNVLADLQNAEQALLLSLSHCAEQAGRPTEDQFDLFLKSYEDFHNKLLRLEAENITATMGIDVVTGFKNDAPLLTDLTRELDRRSRRGNPFSIIALRLDGNPEQDEHDFQVQTLALAIRQTVRSFDDVYRIGSRNFLISLKHSNASGAMKFADRIRAELKRLGATFTLSSCVAEPEAGDDMSAMLNHIEKDLDNISGKGGGETIKYEDVSPLQRFISTIKN